MIDAKGGQLWHYKQYSGGRVVDLHFYRPNNEENREDGDGYKWLVSSN